MKMSLGLNKGFKSEGFSIGMTPRELHGISDKDKSITMKPDFVGSATEGVTIDANVWLPRAAEHYNISPHLSDYVMAPIPAIVTSIPNTNGDCVTNEEMLRFNPKTGQLSYKSFKGKPTHVEHVNKDHTIAKGVILDSYLQPLKGFRGKKAKMVLLLAFDRTRDPELCRKILSGELNTYSIGMYYTAYTCSYCGHRVTQDNINHVCSHTRLRRPTYLAPDKRLVYRQCENIEGFECSAVGDPAYVSAHHNQNQLMYV